MLDDNKIQEILSNHSRDIKLIEREIEYLKQNINNQQILYKELLNKIDELGKTNVELKILIQKLNEKIDNEIMIINKEMDHEKLYHEFIHKLLREEDLKKLVILSTVKAISIFGPIISLIVSLVVYFMSKG